jgi:predicted nucleic acid-binding protein
VANTYTVDASVFLSAFNPQEAEHEHSRQLLAILQEQSAPIIVPTLVLPEVSAVIRRGRGSAALARQFSATLERLPHLLWISLDAALARLASEAAAEYRLKGSDAVYAAVALRFGTTLVTLDREQHDRLVRALPSRYPAELLAEMG